MRVVRDGVDQWATPVRTDAHLYTGRRPLRTGPHRGRVPHPPNPKPVLGVGPPALTRPVVTIGAEGVLRIRYLPPEEEEKGSRDHPFDYLPDPEPSPGCPEGPGT